MEEKLTAALIFDKLLPEYLLKDHTIAKKIGAPLAIDLEGDGGGQWSADFSLNDPYVKRGLSDSAKCVICMNVEDFNFLVNQKKIRPWLEAFKSKKIKVKGHLPTAIKLRVIAQAYDKDKKSEI